jgi:hypothetical protein
MDLMASATSAAFDLVYMNIMQVAVTIPEVRARICFFILGQHFVMAIETEPVFPLFVRRIKIFRVAEFKDLVKISAVRVMAGGAVAVGHGSVFLFVAGDNGENIIIFSVAADDGFVVAVETEMQGVLLQIAGKHGAMGIMAVQAALALRHSGVFAFGVDDLLQHRLVAPAAKLFGGGLQLKREI